MSAQHTPWRLDKTYSPEASENVLSPYILNSHGDIIASVHFVGDEAERLRVAQLVCAAPDLLALAKQYASECGNCGGSGLVTITTWPGGIEVDNDDQDCPDCADIRRVIARAEGP